MPRHPVLNLAPVDGDFGMGSLREARRGQAGANDHWENCVHANATVWKFNSRNRDPGKSGLGDLENWLWAVQDYVGCNQPGRQSLQERENLRKAAAEAVRKAGKEGSKMEKFLHRELTEGGYSVIFHKKGLIPNDRLEVDLFLPGLKVAIEVDGPSHFFPIWGEANLQKHVRADAHKSGLLLGAGYVVLRIKHLTKSVSNKSQRVMLEAVLDCLEKIKAEFPPKGKRFIELEA
ncbi:MAG: hypothetical protein ABGZ49_08815 [Akkermansiaceae bacterium]